MVCKCMLACKNGCCISHLNFYALPVCENTPQAYDGFDFINHCLHVTVLELQNIRY